MNDGIEGNDDGVAVLKGRRTEKTRRQVCTSQPRTSCLVGGKRTSPGLLQPLGQRNACYPTVTHTGI